MKARQGLWPALAPAAAMLCACGTGFEGAVSHEPAAAYRWRELSPLKMVVLASGPEDRFHLLAYCAGPGQVSLGYFLRAGSTVRDTRLVLRSGAVRGVVDGTLSAGPPELPPEAAPVHLGRPGDRTPELRAVFPVSLPAFSRFLRTGELEVSNSGLTVDSRATSGELKALRSLLTCTRSAG